MAEFERVTVTLPADMAQMVRRCVESGAYASDGEVIREALRAMLDREQERERRLDAVRAKIDAAINNPVRLTPEEVRQRLDRLHREALQGRD